MQTKPLKRGATQARGHPPRVSVVVIFYNAARFLREAIESVRAQGFSDWELLVVDDGSDDGSADIALEYNSRHPERIRYLQHEGRRNRGMSTSRNLGLQEANGELVVFLDADDVLYPNALQTLVGVMQTYPQAAMAFGPEQYWFSWTGQPGDERRDYVAWLRVPTDRLMPPPGVLPLFLRGKAAVPAGMIVRRDAAAQVGGFEEEFPGLYEDQVFCAKICLARPIFAMRECVYRYRQHDGAATTIATLGQERRARLQFLRWLEQYLIQNGIQERDVWEAMRAELGRYGGRGSLANLRHRLFDRTKGVLRSAGRFLPPPLQRWLGARLEGRAYIPPPGWVRFGHLRRLAPIGAKWGFDRGKPVDRYYIEQFLDTHRADIRGRVLEIADDLYIRRFGGTQVERSDVLHPVQGNPRATIIGDLQNAPHIPSGTYDCIILTQTLHLIYDLQVALRTINRILKPEGVLLLTVPGISKISRPDMDRWGEYWRFTSLAVQRLLAEVFSADTIRADAYGNVLAAVAFLEGLAAAELTPAELAFRDPDYEVLISARAVKRG